MTMNEYIKQTGVTLTSIKIRWNPHLNDSGSDQMDNYRVTLRRSKDRTRRQMTLFFSKGMGHHGEPPHAEEVLDCLASDSAGYENAQSFEEWAPDLGYDTDSRKAERIFKQLEKDTERLKSFLGADYDLLFQLEEK